MTRNTGGYAFTDKNGVAFDIEALSTGEARIRIGGTEVVTLTNKAAHGLRDMLNRRYPV